MRNTIKKQQVNLKIDVTTILSVCSQCVSLLGWIKDIACCIY